MLGKPPDVVIEMVSNREGAGRKLRTYAHMRVPYDVIFDPQQQLGHGVLRLYELRGLIYVEMVAGELYELKENPPSYPGGGPMPLS